MAAIGSLLNPLEDNSDIDSSNEVSSVDDYVSSVADEAEMTFGSRTIRKKQKLIKDAAVFKSGLIRGECRYPPFEDHDDLLAEQHESFRLHPAGEIHKYPRHIPYNSGKKLFYEKTGRESFEVFQYEFKVPGQDRVQTMIWDYNIGLVRTTPLFKCRNYSKTTPAKMLARNEGLKDICHSITGGALVAQGYWIPYDAAKAVAATFCYEIRYALTPVFGKDFPSLCLKPTNPLFGSMHIDPEITKRCTAQASLYRELELQDTNDRLASSPTASSASNPPRTPVRNRSKNKTGAGAGIGAHKKILPKPMRFTEPYTPSNLVGYTSDPDRYVLSSPGEASPGQVAFTPNGPTSLSTPGSPRARNTASAWSTINGPQVRQRAPSPPSYVRFTNPFSRQPPHSDASSSPTPSDSGTESPTDPSPPPFSLGGRVTRSSKSKAMAQAKANLRKAKTRSKRVQTSDIPRSHATLDLLPPPRKPLYQYEYARYGYNFVTNTAAVAATPPITATEGNAPTLSDIRGTTSTSPTSLSSAVDVPMLDAPFQSPITTTITAAAPSPQSSLSTPTIALRRTHGHGLIDHLADDEEGGYDAESDGSEVEPSRLRTHMHLRHLPAPGGARTVDSRELQHVSSAHGAAQGHGVGLVRGERKRSVTFDQVAAANILLGLSRHDSDADADVGAGGEFGGRSAEAVEGKTQTHGAAGTTNASGADTGRDRTLRAGLLKRRRAASA